MAKELYPNQTRIMTCQLCKTEKMVFVGGLTKEEVVNKLTTFICRQCKAPIEFDYHSWRNSTR
jgi:hypothetical protein